ncbi:MAG: EAL domain-containing protein [Thermoleophilaceae bacterium]
MPSWTLAELRRLVGVMLDDFGTGYSSLSHLHRFPVDVLKIDRSFILGLAEVSVLGDRRRDRRHGPLRWASIVAEGIETREQAAEATRLGCDSAQGYLFARPAPPASDEGLPGA